jgi:hypothetical protein
MYFMFMSVGSDWVSELPPPAGLLLILQMIYECGEPWQNDNDRRKPKNSEKSLYQCHCVYPRSHMD